MEDFDALQGLWKVESRMYQGQPVGHNFTHYEFAGNEVKQIDPDLVDGGKWRTFVIDPTTLPKRLNITEEHQKRDGEMLLITHGEYYELAVDTLRIGSPPIFGQRPPEITDTVYSVTTLSRYRGERPMTKQASGIQPIENAILGTVTWNDDFDQWEATVELFAGQKVEISLSSKNELGEEAITAGAELIKWLRAHEKTARAYAAQQMLELAEEWRDEEEDTDEITVESFVERIVLESITIEETGESKLWYNDDEIFAGHVIVVTVSAERDFTDAEMMG